MSENSVEQAEKDESPQIWLLCSHFEIAGYRD